MKDILIGFFVAVVPVLLYVIKILREKQKKTEEENRIKEEENMTKDEILLEITSVVLADKIDTYIKQGCATIYKKQQINDLFIRYKKLGGNGAVEQIIEEFNHLPSA